MTGLIIAKARLRRDVPAVALAALLVPEGADRQAGASHRLLWSLYADTPERQRDFLWRQTDAGEFLMLGPRAPVDAHGLFELEHKPFAPALRVGQHLTFDLRANATLTVRGRRHDIVMHALHSVPPGERATRRDQLTQDAATTWLQHQGARCGFALVPDALRVDRYQQQRVPHGRRPIQLSVLDLAGELVVRDPEQLLTGVAGGFGRGRAFGCGLLLLRRA